MRHLIKKQVIELSLDERLNYFHVQQQVSDRYWNDIVPIIGKTFDAVSAMDELIEIDRLELDLGVLSEKDLMSRDWIQKVRMKIEEKIAMVTDRGSEGVLVRSRDRKHGVFDQWLFYMDHGYLSWNSDIPGDKWRMDVLEVITVSPPDRQLIRNRIMQDQNFLERLVYLHDDDFLNDMTRIISGIKQKDLRENMAQILSLNRYLAAKEKKTGSENDNSLRNRLWQKVFREAFTESKPEKIMTNLILSFLIDKKVITRIPADKAADFPLIIPVLNKLQNELRKQLRRDKMAVEKAVSDLRSPVRAIQDADPVTKQPAGFDGNKIDEEGIFIVNAGVVLIHPFLKTLFTRLGLIKENRFAGEAARMTCIYLIHYLGTGRTDAEEYELTMAKLLCSFPPGSPVEPVVAQPDFLTEADNLIEAALAQWNILKNTSPAGLREGFLQRPGKVFSKNSNIYVRVERSPIDVLLDYLPWNLSIIVLPWMKDVIRVEWR